jgi:hypothetical protein
MPCILGYSKFIFKHATSEDFPRQQNKVGDFLLSFPWEPFIVWSTMMKTVIKIDLHYITSLLPFLYECKDSFSPNLKEKPRVRLLEHRKHFRAFGMSYRKTEKSARWRVSYMAVLVWTKKVMQAGIFSVHGDEICSTNLAGKLSRDETMWKT